MLLNILYTFVNSCVDLDKILTVFEDCTCGTIFSVPPSEDNRRDGMYIYVYIFMLSRNREKGRKKEREANS